MRAVGTILALLAVPALVQAAGVQKFGKPLTLKTETKVSDILAKPEAFKGKRVRIRGIATDVCAERGCYLVVKGDQRYQSLMVKVDDGVIVFPVSLKGREVVAEGTVFVRTYSVEDLKAMCPIEAKALDPTFDPENIKGPLVIVRLDGLGAEARN